MKTLILARHGTAEERRLGENDFERTLTEAGKKESAFAGNSLRRINLIPELVISSPAPRAYETAKIISGKIKFPENKIQTEKVLYTGNVQEVLNILRQISSDKKIVMLCGHNPLLEEIFASLCEGRVKGIHKGDIVSIALEVEDWKNIKTNTGRNNFTITKNKTKKQFDMRNNKTKNQKKELQAQAAALLIAFAKSKTKTGSKKIGKSVKEASKLVAKAIYKTLNSEVPAKKKTVEKKKVKVSAAQKTKPVIKKNPVKKTAPSKIKSQNLRESTNNLTAKISPVESNPLHA